MQHISGKSDRTTRVSGGGLLGSQPTRTRPRDEDGAAANVIEPPRLFRPDPDRAAADEGPDEFVAVSVPVASSSRERLSTLPPPPKKKPRTTSSSSAKREYVEGEKELPAATTARGTGKGKGKARAQPTTTKKRLEKLAPATDPVELPAHLAKLEKTFQALNTVYTFCSARKSMATTFEVLKGSVENLLKRCGHDPLFCILRGVGWEGTSLVTLSTVY